MRFDLSLKAILAFNTTIDESISISLKKDKIKDKEKTFREKVYKLYKEHKCERPTIDSFSPEIL